jgi:hypothetical protein
MVIKNRDLMLAEVIEDIKSDKFRNKNRCGGVI